MPTTRPRPPPAWTPEPWSYGETSALLDAWGPRHLRGGGGPLRAADWRACAANVTSRRPTGGRAPRTVDQCKNRMDYLKKRLRAERSRPRGAAPPPPPLSGSLDHLRKLLRQAPSVPHGLAPRGGAMPKVEEDDDDDEEEEDEDEESSAAPPPQNWPPVPKRRRTAVLLSPVSSSTGNHHENGGAGCTEVAAALDRLAGTYEAAKQREAARLEERRLEAMRNLEKERMRILVDVAISASTDTDDASAAATASGGLAEELGQ